MVTTHRRNRILSSYRRAVGATSAPEWIDIHSAQTEIRDALNIPRDAALMILFGLCATCNTRSANDTPKIIDADDITVSDLFSSLAYVDAVDVRHHLSEWSAKPQQTILIA